MMTLEQIRQRNKAENAAAQRLQAAGYRLEGWDPRTGQRIAAQITGENTNDERRTFYAFPTWQDAAAGTSPPCMIVLFPATPSFPWIGRSVTGSKPRLTAARA